MAGAHIRPTGARPLLRRGNGRRVAPGRGRSARGDARDPPPTAASMPNQDSPVAVTADDPGGPAGRHLAAAPPRGPDAVLGQTGGVGRARRQLPLVPGPRRRAPRRAPESTIRGLSTLARQVYGYSLAFMLTGEERYLGYAKAGLDWINTKAKDPVYGGYYGRLDDQRATRSTRTPTRTSSTWPRSVWPTACTSTSLATRPPRPTCWPCATCSSTSTTTPAGNRVKDASRPTTWRQRSTPTTTAATSPTCSCPARRCCSPTSRS